MPIIFQACEEKQFSYEYRHGVQSYGAFTYFLDQTMRDAGKRKPTWSRLIQEVGTRLKESLRYDQTPCLVCPKAFETQRIRWNSK